MFLLAASVLACAIPAHAQSNAITYRFDDVRRSVTVTSASHDRSAAKGQSAASGDRVRTGWFSYARITVPQHKAHFEIFSSTEVELASNTPGVILSLNRGRIQAVFDKITGSEPRIVQTPGALLAVRGTQYSVEVDAKGQTMLDVFEGAVEVRSPLRREPLLVPAGQSSTFSRQHPPDAPRPTPPSRARDANDARRKADDDSGRGNNGPQGGNGTDRGGNPGSLGNDRPGSGPGGNGGGARPPAPPPPGPGPRPPVD
jgi:hypothetical protein